MNPENIQVEELGLPCAVCFAASGDLLVAGERETYWSQLKESVKKKE